MQAQTGAQRCPNCSYLLVGLTTACQCPECGLDVFPLMSIVYAARGDKAMLLIANATLIIFGVGLWYFRVGQGISATMFLTTGVIGLLGAWRFLSSAGTFAMVTDQDVRIMKGLTISRQIPLDGISGAKWRILDGSIVLHDVSGQRALRLPWRPLGSAWRARQLAHAINKHLRDRNARP